MTQRRFALSLALVATLAVVTAACGSDDSASESTTTTAAASTTSMGDMPGMDHSSSSQPGDCPMHMPEDVLSAEEAVITFEGSKLCLGYVTVRPGTEVTWENQGDKATTLSLYDAFPKSGSKPTETDEIAAGARRTQAFDTPGLRYYTLDLLPGFVGTVDVKAA